MVYRVCVTFHLWANYPNPFSLGCFLITSMADIVSDCLFLSEHGALWTSPICHLLLLLISITYAYDDITNYVEIPCQSVDFFIFVLLSFAKFVFLVSNTVL